jgi:hypothetical protein
MRIRPPFILPVLLMSLVTSPLAASQPPAAIQPGADLFEAGDFKAATDFFSGLEGTEKTWANHFLGRLQFEKADWDGAIERLTAAG